MKRNLLLFCLFQCSVILVFAQGGTLDVSFAGNGKLATDIGDNIAEADAIAVQSNGMIVAAGQYKSGANMWGDLFSFAVTRYSKTGTPDTQFGSGGRLYLNVNCPFLYLASVVIQPADQKIILAGYIVPAGANSPELWLTRLNIDGTPDPQFNHGNVVTVTDYMGVQAIVQTNGQIVVGANYFYEANSNLSYFAALRFNTDGTPDNGFGTGGKTFTYIGSAAQKGFAVGSAVTTSGQVLVTGGYNSTHIITVRFNIDGSPDGNFGSGGQSDLTVNTNDQLGASAIGLQTDGKIIIGGTYTSANGPTNFLIARLSSKGVPDNSFAGNGKKGVNINNNAVLSGIAVSSDGTIFAGGTTQVSAQQPPRFALCRVLSDGSMDLIYGPNGDGTATAGWSNAAGSGKCIALQPDEKVVMGGVYALAQQNAFPEFAVMRFLAPFKPPIQKVEDLSVAVAATPLEMALTGVRLYPNPATTQLQVAGLPVDGTTLLTVTDMTGKTILQQHAANANVVLDISRFAPGSYVLTVTGPAARQSFSFVKERS